MSLVGRACLARPFLCYNTTMDLKFISYDGKYPNLCRGQLIVEIDGKRTSFGLPLFKKDVHFDFKSFWTPGGNVRLIPDSWEPIVSHGPWEMDSFVSEKDFPKEIWDAMPQLIELMNANVPYACCGGCI